MTIPSATRPMMEKAAERADRVINSANPTVKTPAQRSFEAGNLSPLTAVSVHTHTPTENVEDFINSQTGAAMALLQGHAGLGQTINGVVVTCFLIGWFTRDEQVKEEAAEAEAIDPPAICSNTQSELKKFRFCPDCGIVRALHSEDS